MTEINKSEFDGGEKNHEKRENQVYIFFTCFNMFLYSVNSEFCG